MANKDFNRVTIIKEQKSFTDQFNSFSAFFFNSLKWIIFGSVCVCLYACASVCANMSNITEDNNKPVWTGGGKESV